MLDKMKYNSDSPLLASLGTGRGKSELRRAQTSPARSDKVEKHWVSHPPRLSVTSVLPWVSVVFQGRRTQPRKSLDHL